MNAPLDAIRDLQWLARTHPEMREIADKAISAILVLQDKLRKQEAER
jgi:hypothetical protein